MAIDAYAHYSEEYKQRLNQSLTTRGFLNPDGSVNRTLTTTDEHGTTTWIRGLLGLPVDSDDVIALGTALTLPIEITRDVTSFAQSVVSILQQVAYLIIDPVYLVMSTAVQVIRDFINSVLNAKISFIYDYSTIDNPRSVTDLMRVMSKSVVDRADLHRPIVDQVPLQSTIEGLPITDEFIYAPGGARVYQAYLIFACPGIQSVYKLIENIKQLLTLPDITIPDLSLQVDRSTFTKTRKDDYQAPDWFGQNASDILPVLKDIYLFLQQTLDVIILARDSILDQIDRLIVLLEYKLQQLDNIIGILDNIIEAIILLLSFGPLLVYTVDGTYNSGELESAIARSILNAPFSFDDVGIVLGFSVTAPLPDTGGGVDSILDSAESFNTSVQTIKALLGIT